MSTNIKEPGVADSESISSFLLTLIRQTKVLQKFIQAVIAEHQEENGEQIRKAYKEFKEGKYVILFQNGRRITGDKY